MRETTYTKQQILELLLDADIEVLNAVGFLLQEERKRYPLNDWLDIEIAFMEQKITLLVECFLKMVALRDHPSIPDGHEEKITHVVENIEKLSFELGQIKARRA